MSEMISLPVNDIPDPSRRALESLLGHPLAADQQVFVMVSSAGTVADATTRRAAIENIRRTLDTIDQFRNLAAIADEEVDASIEEALSQVRPRPI